MTTSINWTLLLSTVVWGAYGITTSALVIVHDYSSFWAWLSVITAIIGNSAHLVYFAVSQKGVVIKNPQG